MDSFINAVGLYLTILQIGLLNLKRSLSDRLAQIDKKAIL